MFDWFFNLFRPEPKFRPGQLTSVQTTNVYKGCYMLVEERRWTKVIMGTTGPRKQWVYDGHILTGNPGGEILRLTGGMCFLESHLGYARGFEY